MPYKIVSPDEFSQLQPKSSRYKIVSPDEFSQLQSQDDYSQVGGVVQPIVQGGARAVESFLGLPSDIVQLGGHLLNFGIKSATGKSIDFLSELPLPTSENIRKYGTEPVAEFFGGEGAISQKQPINELLDFVGSVGGSLAFPAGALFGSAAKAAGLGSKAIKAAEFIGGGKSLSPMKALTTAGAGGLVKFGAKKVGLPDIAGDTLSIGSMIGMNLIGPQRALQMANNLYRNSENIVTKFPTLPRKYAREFITKIEKLERNNFLPSKFKGYINDFYEGAIKGETDVKNLLNLNKELNKQFYDKASTMAFKDSFPKLKDEFYNIMKRYGKETGTNFFDTFSDAQNLSSAAYKAQNVSSDLAKKLPKNLNVATLGLILGASHPITAAKAALIGYPLHKLFQSYSVLKNNKMAQNAFYNTVSSAMKGNVRNMNKSANKLDQIVTNLDN